MKLYHYWRSSSSWRVRWALDYKNIPYELVHINLLNGEAETPEHLARHPLGYVPALQTDRGDTIVESLAIIHYLESVFPGTPNVYPKDPVDCAKALAFAEIINSGTHPFQNPPVTAHLAEIFGATSEEQKSWSQFWILRGLGLYEQLLPDSILKNETPFSLQSGFSIADICLLPQLYNAMRYEVNLEPFPKIRAIAIHLGNMESYKSSHASRYEPK